LKEWWKEETDKYYASTNQRYHQMKAHTWRSKDDTHQTWKLLSKEEKVSYTGHPKGAEMVMHNLEESGGGHISPNTIACETCIHTMPPPSRLPLKEYVKF